MKKQQKSTTGRIPESALEENSESERQEEIAALAYQLWQGRGYPNGTPEEDWFRAEREVERPGRIDEEEVGSRDSAQRSIDAEEAHSPELRFPIRSEISQASHKTADSRTA
jgi:hypothetical protein